MPDDVPHEMKSQQNSHGLRPSGLISFGVRVRVRGILNFGPTPHSLAAVLRVTRAKPRSLFLPSQLALAFSAQSSGAPATAIACRLFALLTRSVSAEQVNSHRFASCSPLIVLSRVCAHIAMVEDAFVVITHANALHGVQLQFACVRKFNDLLGFLGTLVAHHIIN